MANFDTHIAASTLTSAVLSSFCIHAGLVNFEQVLMLWLLGSLAGLLPDIDSDNSTSLNLLFHIGYFVLLFWLSFNVWSGESLLYLWVAALLLYALLRLAVLPFFTRMSNHRGHCHSLVAAMVFSLAVAVFSYQLLGIDAILSWLAGLFTFTGVITHLVLDEWAAVEWRTYSVKGSFGTAMKPFHRKHYPVLAMLLASLVGLYWYAPDKQVLVSQILPQLVDINEDKGQSSLYSWFNGWFNGGE